MKRYRNHFFQDLTNKEFGRLVVLRFSHFENHRAYFVCECSCNGKELVVMGHYLQSGDTQSCGCLQKEAIQKIGSSNKIHGATANNKMTSEYEAWHSMKGRCLNPNDPNYPRYGGRGIKVCKRWLTSFQNFINDLGKKPSSKYSLDRIDVNGNYEPSNCRWATPIEQARNRRDSSPTNNYKQHHYWQLRLQKLSRHIIKSNDINSPLFEYYIGCTPTEFRDYIESQFEPWMNWDNYGIGKNKWSLDHIKLCNTFDLSKKEDRKKCFHYKNLRPYNSIKNRKEHIR